MKDCSVANALVPCAYFLSSPLEISTSRLRLFLKSSSSFVGRISTFSSNGSKGPGCRSRLLQTRARCHVCWACFSPPSRLRRSFPPRRLSVSLTKFASVRNKNLLYLQSCQGLSAYLSISRGLASRARIGNGSVRQKQTRGARWSRLPIGSAIVEVLINFATASSASLTVVGASRSTNSPTNLRTKSKPTRSVTADARF